MVAGLFNKGGTTSADTEKLPSATMSQPRVILRVSRIQSHTRGSHEKVFPTRGSHEEVFHRVVSRWKGVTSRELLKRLVKVETQFQK